MVPLVTPTVWKEFPRWGLILFSEQIACVIPATLDKLGSNSAMSMVLFVSRWCWTMFQLLFEYPVEQVIARYCSVQWLSPGTV